MQARRKENGVPLRLILTEPRDGAPATNEAYEDILKRYCWGCSGGHVPVLHEGVAFHPVVAVSPDGNTSQLWMRCTRKGTHE
jgi:hypothetical protein